ncbi:hypothetical protein [Paludisphaera soli]|uniref:hypothetical protein n=1 Tax=Paludisphaera soli TaxID=2712865 RepID=UPI001981D2CF|nr:hypothetical protein [Paludisphaera soli]
MVLRRNVLLAWSAGLVVSLGVVGLGRGFAQEAKVEVEKAGAPVEAPKPEEPKKEEAPKAEEPKAEAPKAETPADTAPPTIPPEVEAKLEAARHAVAEAIVAAQDAGLVDSSIDPPPILDILIKGYADDGKTLKNKDGKKPYAVSPEVLGAWFTGFGKIEGVNYVQDVRIVNPNAGLKDWYNQRAAILNRHIEAVRKDKPAPAAAPAEAPKAEEPKEEPKPEAPKAEEPKPEAPKEEPKAEAPAEAPKAEAPKAEAPAEAPKAEAPAEAPKAE